MILNPQNKTYQTRSDKPNENWTGGDSYIAIPDGSELARKIIANYPWFDIVYDDEGNVADVTPTEPEEQDPTAEKQIAELTAQLDATDYKIIKCAEYQLAGLDLPYDIEELHSGRQSLRDKINELEA